MPNKDSGIVHYTRIVDIRDTYTISQRFMKTRRHRHQALTSELPLERRSCKSGVLSVIEGRESVSLVFQRLPLDDWRIFLIPLITVHLRSEVLRHPIGAEPLNSARLVLSIGLLPVVQEFQMT